MVGISVAPKYLILILFRMYHNFQNSVFTTYVSHLFNRRYTLCDGEMRQRGDIQMKQAFVIFKAQLTG